MSVPRAYAELHGLDGRLGPFTRQGVPRSCQQLVELYAWLCVEYGIIKARIPPLLATRAEA
jgi:hypothetical protein